MKITTATIMQLQRGQEALAREETSRSSQVALDYFDKARGFEWARDCRNRAKEASALAKQLETVVAMTATTREEMES